MKISLMFSIKYNEDLHYVNEQCMRKPPLDPTLPFLFYRRIDVDAHNTKILAIVPGEMIVLNAIDKYDENNSTLHLHTRTISLPHQIHLKPNILVELYAGNYNTKDGLVNGSDGIFKAYTKYNDFDIVWIRFNDNTIGQQQRKKLIQCYT